MKKFLTVLLTGILAGSVLAGCGGSGDPAGSTSGTSAGSNAAAGTADASEFVIALDRDTNTLDPANVYSPDAYVIERSMVEALTTNDEDGNIVGNLAKDWKSSEDGMQYIFNLRDDVYFWDGTQMTSEDVKFCLERVCDE